MSKSGKSRTAWKTQRALLCELPGLGKPGALERRPYPPGVHGHSRKKFSEYALRLREKQKMMFHYCLRESQLRVFVRRAKSGRSSDWMATLIGLLESRLDNVVFRLGFAPSIPAARQLVSHGKVLVRGRCVDRPSALVRVGEEISLTEKAYKMGLCLGSLQSPRLELPNWLEYVQKGERTEGKLKSVPEANAIPFEFDGRLVTEYYSGL